MFFMIYIYNIYIHSLQVMQRSYCYRSMLAIVSQAAEAYVFVEGPNLSQAAAQKQKQKLAIFLDPSSQRLS